MVISVNAWPRCSQSKGPHYLLRAEQYFDELAFNTSPEEVAAKVPIFRSMEKLMEVKTYEMLVADRIILHNVNRLQETFIEHFAFYRQGLLLLSYLLFNYLLNR